MERKGQGSVEDLLGEAQERLRRGEREQARKLVKKALNRMDLDPDFPPGLVAEALSFAGALFISLEMIEEAEEVYLRALAAAEEFYGPDSIQLAVCMGSLASIRYYQGRFQEAEILSRKALLAADQALEEDAGPMTELRSAMRFMFKHKEEPLS